MFLWNLSAKENIDINKSDQYIYTATNINKVINTRSFEILIIID